MSRSDKIALALSLLAILFSYLVADRIFERMAHLEDEMAYVWQAQAISGGKLTVPSPPEPKSFLWPFVVDYNGQRFGKYPIAWPALLSLGERIGQRSLVNPLLAGLAIWLIYRLGKRIFGETVGLLAAGLTLTSPFFLVNSGSLLSHPLGLVLSTGFALAWLAAFTPPTPSRPWLAVITAGCALGLLALTRPLTAFAVAVPFMLHGLVLYFKRDGQVRRNLLVFIAIVLGMGTLHFVWQYAVTGDALLNPYTLWWPYDKIGFGPGHGHNPVGHTLRQAWLNTKFSIKVGAFDLYGWPKISWLFLPVGLAVAIRQRTTRLPALLISGVFITLVAFYLAYWVGASLLWAALLLRGVIQPLHPVCSRDRLAGWLAYPPGPNPHAFPGLAALASFSRNCSAYLAGRFQPGFLSPCPLTRDDRPLWRKPRKFGAISHRDSPADDARLDHCPSPRKVDRVWHTLGVGKPIPGYPFYFCLFAQRALQPVVGIPVPRSGCLPLLCR